MSHLPFILAQSDSGFFRNRSGETDSCVESNGFCPNWIVHHLDRYVSPFWQHLFLVTVSVAIGFAIAFALALLAHRRRWATSASTNAMAKPIATDTTTRNRCCQNGET